MLKKLFFISLSLLSINTHAADYLDTQYGDDGLEAHIMKATINHNILTIVFAFENTGSETITIPSIPVSQVFYNTNDKKYPVLKDAEKKWLASTIIYNRFTESNSRIFTGREDGDSNHTLAITAGKKKIGWIKFEAPKDSVWPLDLNMPSITPFTVNKP